MNHSIEINTKRTKNRVLAIILLTALIPMAALTLAPDTLPYAVSLAIALPFFTLSSLEKLTPQDHQV